ncbi:MAG: FlgO family outer membrane protein, partial [Pseudomonadota bacterium]
ARLLAAFGSFRAGDYQAALEHASGMATDSARPEVLRLRAVALAHTGEREKALLAFGSAKLEDGDVEALALYAKLLGEKGQWSQAAEVLGRATESAAPASRALLLDLARAHVSAGNSHQAIASLERALVLDPNDKESLYQLARLYLVADRPVEAEIVLRRFAGNVPVLGGANRDESVRWPDHDLFVVPLPPFDRVLPPEAGVAAASLKLAAMLAAQGRLEEARAMLAAIEGQRQSVPGGSAGATAETQQAGSPSPPAVVQYAKGVIALRRGYLDEAEKLFLAASEGEPSPSTPTMALGIVTLRRGDLGNARELLERSIGLQPASDLWARLGLAVVMARSGKSDEAMASFNDIAARWTTGPEAYLNAAIAAYLGKRPAVADKYLAKLGKEWGGGLEIPERSMLAGLLARDAGNDKAAAKAFQRAIELAPEYYDAWLALGHVASRLGNHSLAADAFGKVVARRPGDLEKRELLAKALEAAGDTLAASRERERIAGHREEARKELKQAVRDDAIGVAAFENTSKNADYEWLQHGLAEALATDLRRTGLRIVERSQIAKAMDEQKLGELGLVDPATAPKIGKLAGAQAMIVGAYQIQGDSLRITARLVDVEDGHVIQAAEASGLIASLFALERRLAMELVGNYYGVDDATRKKVFQAPATTLKALEQVASARLLLFKGEHEAARERFQRAMEEDPGFAKEVAKLQTEWSSLAANVACLPLANISGSKEQEWYSRGIAESLSGDLKRLGILMVERLAIDKVLAEKRFTDFFNPDQAQAIGTKLGAGMLVVGSYQSLGGRLQIDVRIVEVDTSQVLLAERIVGPEAELFELQAQLAGKIARILNRPVTPEELARLREGKPSVDDFKRYVRQQSQLAIGGDKPAERVTVSSVAVGAFENTSGQPAHASLADRLVRVVGERLAASKRLRVVDHEAVLAAAKTGGDPRALGMQVSADAVVLGSYQVAEQRLRIEGRVVSVKSGEVLVSAKAEGSIGDIDKVEDGLSRSLLAGLGLEVRDTPEEKKTKQARSLHRQWWFWSGVGAAVVAGTALAFIAGSSEPGLPAADVGIDCRGGTCK